MPKDSESNAPEQNLDLGILVGLLITDGCVSVNNGNWRVNFTGTSEVLHKLFKTKMKRIFGVKKFIEYVDKKGVKSTEVNNKSIVQILLNICPTYRTKRLSSGKFPPAKIPSFIENLPVEELSHVLRAMFSADGSVSLGAYWNYNKKSWSLVRRIKFSSHHPIIRKQIYKILMRKYEIIPQIWEDAVVIERHNDILKFYKRIGFVKGVVNTGDSKYWRGIDKNSVLRTVCKTLGNNEFRNVSSKKDVFVFLRKQF